MHREGITGRRTPPQPLTSLSLTHVRFAADNIYSKIFAYLTLSPLAITCGYIAVVLATRDLSVILMFGGQLLNECINFVLKRIVKQARPTAELGDGYGMPSSHSQFMAYFATYTILLMYRAGASSGNWSQHLISVVVVTWSFLVVYSRFLRSKGMQDWMLDNPFGRWVCLVERGRLDNVYQWEWDQFQQWRRINQGKND
ncbi:hypothetical protein BGZ65_009799 [Modicella reniformis]|uniref:Dolichyldiphosphatase n=1 Tax=Modicella reniformis TaxID=1440133 RepID=A0A9P6J4C9_9FUNG|nr:hypothetical protein BGZ65_009799 [Modicella reniformis]